MRIRKKNIVFVLLLTLVVSVTACGDTEKENDIYDEITGDNNDQSNQEDGSQEKIETERITITAENWQDYLEFGMVPCTVYEGNELVNIELHNCIFIKEEYADRYVDGAISGVVTASSGMPMAYFVKYYISSKDFSVEEKTKDSSSSARIKNSINQSFSVSGEELILNNKNPDCIWCMDGYTMMSFTSNDDDGKGEYHWAMCLNPEDIAVKNVSGTLELEK